MGSHSREREKEVVPLPFDLSSLLHHTHTHTRTSIGTGIMASTEKFQAGEKYGDEEISHYSMDDPAELAKGLIKELASVGTQVSLLDAIGMIKALKEKPLDDRKGYVASLRAGCMIDSGLRSRH